MVVEVDDVSLCNGSLLGNFSSVEDVFSQPSIVNVIVSENSIITTLLQKGYSGPRSTSNNFGLSMYCN